MPTYAPGLTLVRGAGVSVWDDTGKEYLDFMAGIAVCNTGHCHPAVVAAVQHQAATLMHCSNLFHNPVQPRLAERLSRLTLGGKIFFCNSGAEANEALFKLARKWGSLDGRFEIITMKNSFHGRTLATMTATGQTKYQKGFEPLVPGFVHAEFNDLDSVRAAVTPATVTILYAKPSRRRRRHPRPAFIASLRALCDEKLLLLFGEVVRHRPHRQMVRFPAPRHPPDGLSMAEALAGDYISAAAISGTLQRLRPATTPAPSAAPLASAAASPSSTIENEGRRSACREDGALFMDGLETWPQASPASRPCAASLRRRHRTSRTNPIEARLPRERPAVHRHQRPRPALRVRSSSPRPHRQALDILGARSTRSGPFAVKPSARFIPAPAMLHLPPQDFSGLTAGLTSAAPSTPAPPKTARIHQLQCHPQHLNDGDSFHIKPSNIDHRFPSSASISWAPESEKSLPDASRNRPTVRHGQHGCRRVGKDAINSRKNSWPAAVASASASPTPWAAPPRTAATP